MGRKLQFAAMAAWGLIGLYDPAGAFLYSTTDIEVSIRKEYIQTGSEPPVPNLPTPWCVSMTGKFSSRAIEAQLNPPAGSTLPSGVLSLGQTVCFATLEDLTAAVPVGTYSLTALMKAANTNDPPVPVNATIDIDYPFVLTNEVPVVESLSWDEGILHAHKQVPLQLSLMEDPYAGSYPWCRTSVNKPDGTAWFCATSVGTPFGSLQYVRIPNPYALQFSFLHELHATDSPYRIAVAYEVRTSADMILHSDPELRISVDAAGVGLFGSELLPHTGYEVQAAQNLAVSALWSPVATFVATGTTHDISGFAAIGDANCYRLRLVP